jgi:hypothetical protein
MATMVMKMHHNVTYFNSMNIHAQTLSCGTGSYVVHLINETSHYTIKNTVGWVTESDFAKRFS